MNDRMTELYAKACLDARDIHPTDVPAFIACMAEKFAELIVRECVTTIANDTANYPGVGMMAYYQGVQDSAKAIKQHFGVEE